MEIVDNGGEVLENELGIDKASFRKKIVRQMQARMLGIGSTPGPPQKFTHKLDSCKVVTLSWERSTARVFPVHSYRIQRRAINLFGSEATTSTDVSASTNSNIFDSSPSSDWKTVYVGGETEYVDSGLETGHNYMYRIQAWNSVGKSSWETVDLSRALKKQRCTSKPSQTKFVSERGIPSSLEDETQWGLISIFRGVVSFIRVIYHSVRFVLALFALLAGMMRFRRATATSSASASTTLPFPSFWKAINRLTRKAIGYELIPGTMLGDREAIMRQEKLHDERVMAKGLRGYERVTKKSESGVTGKSSHTSDLNNALDRRNAMKRVKSHSTGNLAAATVKCTPPREVTIPRESATPNKFGWMRPTQKRNGGTVSFGGTTISESSESSSLSPTHSRSRGGSSLSKSDHPSFGISRKPSQVDDGSICSECQKRFRIGKRYKHHCSRCMATFCHKDGRTTHSNFTSCKVPGDCVCNSCLRVMSERSV